MTRYLSFAILCCQILHSAQVGAATLPHRPIYPILPYMYSRIFQGARGTKFRKYHKTSSKVNYLGWPRQSHGRRPHQRRRPVSVSRVVSAPCSLFSVCSVVHCARCGCGLVTVDLAVTCSPSARVADGVDYSPAFYAMEVWMVLTIVTIFVFHLHVSLPEKAQLGQLFKVRRHRGPDPHTVSSGTGTQGTHRGLGQSAPRLQTETEIIMES